jgi:alpha-galactosidase
MNMKGRTVKLQGLDPDALYKVEGTDETYYGDVLMNVGYHFPEIRGDFQSRLVHFCRV